MVVVASIKLPAVLGIAYDELGLREVYKTRLYTDLPFSLAPVLIKLQRVKYVQNEPKPTEREYFFLLCLACTDMHFVPMQPASLYAGRFEIITRCDLVLIEVPPILFSRPCFLIIAREETKPAYQ